MGGSKGKSSEETKEDARDRVMTGGGGDDTGCVHLWGVDGVLHMGDTMFDTNQEKIYHVCDLTPSGGWKLVQTKISYYKTLDDDEIELL